MVNKLIALLIFAALLVFPLVSADLQINIKTLADHKVSVFVLYLKAIMGLLTVLECILLIMLGTLKRSK